MDKRLVGDDITRWVPKTDDCKPTIYLHSSGFGVLVDREEDPNTKLDNHENVAKLLTVRKKINEQVLQEDTRSKKVKNLFVIMKKYKRIIIEYKKISEPTLREYAGSEKGRFLREEVKYLRTQIKNCFCKKLHWRKFCKKVHWGKAQKARWNAWKEVPYVFTFYLAREETLYKILNDINSHRGIIALSDPSMVGFDDMAGGGESSQVPTKIIASRIRRLDASDISDSIDPDQEIFCSATRMGAVVAFLDDGCCSTENTYELLMVRTQIERIVAYQLRQSCEELHRSKINASLRQLDKLTMLVLPFLRQAKLKEASMSTRHSKILVALRQAIGLEEEIESTETVVRYIASKRAYELNIFFNKLSAFAISFSLLSLGSAVYSQEKEWFVATIVGTVILGFGMLFALLLPFLKE